MGAVADMTDAQRVEVLRLAQAILQSIEDDAVMPLPMRFEIISDSGPFARKETTSRDQVEALVASLALEIVELQRERDNARGIARVLAHSYEHDSRPPGNYVAAALAFPAIPRTP